MTRTEAGLRFTLKPEGNHRRSLLSGGLVSLKFSRGVPTFGEASLRNVEAADQFFVDYALGEAKGNLVARIASVDIWEQGDFGGWRHPAPAVWPVATHGWMIARVNLFGLYDFPEWRLHDPSVLRGFAPDWQAVDAATAGGVTFNADGELLLWRGNTLERATSDAKERVVARVPIPGFDKHGPPNVLDDPLGKRAVYDNYSQLVRFSEIAPDGTLRIVTIDGYVNEVATSGNVRRWDLIPEIVPIAECPKHHEAAWHTEERAHRSQHFTSRFNKSSSFGEKGTVIAGDVVAGWSGLGQTLWWFQNGQVDDHQIAPHDIRVKELAGNPDGSVLLIGRKQPEVRTETVTDTGGDEFEIEIRPDADDLAAPPLVIRPGQPPEPIGPGRPASAAAFSPDGSQLALADEAEGRHGITVIDSNTSETLLAAHAADRPLDHSPPAWSRDGRRVAFSDETHIYVADLPQGRVYQLLKPIISDGPHSVPLKPIHQLALSPNGDRVAFLIRPSQTYMHRKVPKLYMTNLPE